MSRGTLESLKSLGQKLDARWQREFAGQSRHTRELDVLDRMLEKAAGIVRKARPLKGAAAEDLKAGAAARVELYRKERAAIAEARYEKPETGEAFRLGRDVDADYARWRRHFAGKDRRTRDVALLAGMVARLQAAHLRLTAIAGVHADLVNAEFLRDLGTQVELLRDEHGEILKARKILVGADRVIAAIAIGHGLVLRYRTHFAGQARTSADSALLETLIGTLEVTLADADAALAAGGEGGGPLDLATHPQGEAIRADLEAIRADLDLWRNERAAIRAAHEEAGPEARAGALATVANALFARYQEHFAGQPRATRDLDLLSMLCDRLTDVDSQMRALFLRTSDPVLRRNQALVEDRLRVWETEWIEIGRAKAPPAATPSLRP
jgi:hypothetical protein